MQISLLSHQTILEELVHELKQKINIESSPPIRQQAHRIPPFHKDEVKKMLDEMLQKDVITPSKSPWGHHLFLLRRKTAPRVSV